ncbi:MAG: putative toxin, partial [Bacteroidota bacterium]
YNELGELIEKNLHSEDNGSTFSQSTDYRYNIRGWLTRINDSDLSDGEGDLFGMELAYNEDWSEVNNTPSFNGNISAIKWSNELGLSDVKQRAYTYGYDPMNRIKQANHHRQLVSTWGAVNAFSMNIGSYDLNGNIENLTRYGSNGVIDQLTYEYGSAGNQLQAVEDIITETEGFVNGHGGSLANPDYVYDQNGNMTVDKNEDITTIEYNHLNKPSQIQKTDGSYLKFIYDANGIKLAQEAYDGSNTLVKKTDYVGDFIYENDELKLIRHEEGRIVQDPTSGSWDYQYDLVDIWSNTRVSFTTNPKTHEFTATMESESASAEEALFNNLPETRVSFTTASQSPDEVAELDNVNPIGPALSLQVGAGDTVRMEGYAYFEGGSGYNNTTSLTSLIASVASAFGGLNGGTPEQQVTFDAFDNAYGILGMNGSGDSNVPAAYLNYIFFDQDMVYKQSGFKQISGAADFSKEYVVFPTDIIIPESGFIYCFVSMESAVGRVFWDDFKVTVSEHSVTQTDNFYPFGMVHSGGFKRSTSKKNNYLFHNKTELIDDLNLGWYDFKYRLHNPKVGRFFTIDPLAEDYYYNSTYAFAENKLGRGIELEGAELLPFFARPPMAIPRAVPRVTPRVVPRVAPRTTPKSGAKRLPPEVIENFRRGNKTEAEQLSKRGLEKNTKPFDVKDAQTGETTRTIPDSFEGESTVEVKDVASQSLTRQLKAQRQISNGNGTKPKLIIRKGAQLSKPLIEGGFDIEFFSAPPTVPSDATRVVKPIDLKKVEQGQKEQQQQEFSDCVARGDCT